MVHLAITGVPRSGKTTLAGPDAWHTDDLIELGWSEASEKASHWFDEPDCHVIEGVAIPRALRKWLQRNPDGKPCSKLVVLETPYGPGLTEGQRRMGVGVRTVLDEISGELRRRGVAIEYVRLSAGRENPQKV